MAYFPMSVDLTEKTVFLVGNGRQTGEKKEKLRPFGAQLWEFPTLTAAELVEAPAFVVVGDLEYAEKARISALCRERSIPVNVVDVPELCSFFFPAMTVRGELTVSVSTGGRSPAAAASLRRRLEAQLPDNTEEILDWLGENRRRFREMGIARRAAEEALSLDRPLTEDELAKLK